MSDGKSEGTAPNAQRLLWAGFMAILASGVGFSIRAGILGQWSKEFGFTMTELGDITGGGLLDRQEGVEQLRVITCHNAS